MADEAKALVEKLRDDLPQTLIEKHWVDDHDAIYKQREEAADLIETQAREIERLREAVGEICTDSNPDWTEKRVYPNEALDDIHTIAVNAYYKVQTK